MANLSTKHTLYISVKKSLSKGCFQRMFPKGEYIFMLHIVERRMLELEDVDILGVKRLVVSGYEIPNLGSLGECLNSAFSCRLCSVLQHGGGEYRPRMC